VHDKGAESADENEVWWPTTGRGRVTTGATQWGLGSRESRVGVECGHWRGRVQWVGVDIYTFHVRISSHSIYAS
jgi:hypothetical protein